MILFDRPQLVNGVSETMTDVDRSYLLWLEELKQCYVFGKAISHVCQKVDLTPFIYDKNIVQIAA